MSRARTLAFGALAAAISVLALSGVAAAHWTAGGSGSGQASTATLQPLEVTAGTAPPALYPGGVADAVIVVSNPNPFAVSITAIAPGEGALSVSGGSGDCTVPDVQLTAPGASFLADLDAIEPGGPITITLPGAAAMGTLAESGCQGASLSIPVTVEVAR